MLFGAIAAVDEVKGAFGELAGGEIGDLDFEVKWGCPCEEFCPGGDGCVV
jgi:hypothetical protein